MQHISFGDFLRKKRKEKGFTVIEFARMLKTQPSHLTEIENGRRLPPDNDILYRLADTLELDEEERKRLFDLAGVERGKAPKDCCDYIASRPYTWEAIRVAIETKAGENEWREVTDLLLHRKE